MPPFSLKTLLVKSAQNWSRDKASSLAAAFAFFAILSLAPLLVVGVVVVGQIYGSNGLARERLLHVARENIGPGSVDFLRTLLDNAHRSGISTIAGILSLVVAFFGASSMFSQLSDSIDSIWGIAKKGSVIHAFVVGKAVSVLMLLIFAIFVLAWIVLDSVVGAAAKAAGAFSGWPFISFLISTAFLTAVFALTFRGLPAKRVQWRDVWVASLVTALGFSLAKFGLSLYFTYTDVQSAYGPAGALVVILLWIYYSAQILLFGAEVVWAYAHTYGSQKGHVPPEGRFS